MLQGFFFQILAAMVNPMINQKEPMPALKKGGICTEYSLRIDRQARDVHARRAFHNARINTSMPARVTEKGRFIV